jgi:hypothetical protein
MRSSNAGGFARMLDSIEPSLQQDTLERRALRAVRDIEEAPHSRLEPRNSVLREDEDNFEGGSYLSHPRNSSNSMSQRLAPRYQPPQRREPGRYVVGKHTSERSRHKKTIRFQTPATNDISEEIGTMKRHAGQGRTSASQRREPKLTLRFRASTNHSNQSSISETAGPQSISRHPQDDPYWPLENTAHHANPPSNRASRASKLNPASEDTVQLRSTDATQVMTTSNPVRGKARGEALMRVLRTMTSCSMHEKQKLRSKKSSGIKLALIRCSSRDDEDCDLLTNDEIGNRTKQGGEA